MCKCVKMTDTQTQNPINKKFLVNQNDSVHTINFDDVNNYDNNVRYFTVENVDEILNKNIVDIVDFKEVQILHTRDINIEKQNT